MDKEKQPARHDHTPLEVGFDERGSISWEVRNRWHSSYAATPLNARHLREPSGELYICAALNYVNGLLDDLLLRRVIPLTPHVVEHLSIAIQSAVLMRIEENETKSIPMDVDDRSALLFTKACYGGASPEELLDLVITYSKELDSLELAKQTHPGIWSATDDMDEAVGNALIERGFDERSSTKTRNVRYVVTRVDNTKHPETATIIRKADIATRRSAKGGMLMVVQRDSLVVDLTHKDVELAQQEVRRWLQLEVTSDTMRGDVKVPYAGKRLTSFIDQQFETNRDRRSLALVPAVRSYYAHYKNSGSTLRDQISRTGDS